MAIPFFCRIFAQQTNKAQKIIMEPLLSIIIPVYNAGIHFKPCIDSILAQTLHNIEIILVLDCPTDGTDKTAEIYAQNDERVKIIYNTENQHIGNSRNIGMKQAKGKYLAFADHDDILRNDMYEKLCAKAEECLAEIILSLVLTTIPNDSTNDFKFPIVENKREFVLTDLLANGGKNRPETPFNPILGNIYRRDFIESNNFTFLDTKIFSHEDRAFNILTFHAAKEIEWVADAFYTHISHEQNEGTSKNYTSTDHACATMIYLTQQARNWTNFTTYRDFMEQGFKKCFHKHIRESFFAGPLCFTKSCHTLCKTYWTLHKICRTLYTK